MKFRIVTVLLFCTQFTFGQNAVDQKIHWMSWDEAIALQKADREKFSMDQKSNPSPKKIFLDIYTGWCGWCKKMDATTFTHPVIVKYMQENFYAVKLNAEQKEAIHFNGHTFTNPDPDPAKRTVNELASSLLDNKMGYPSTVYLDEKFQRLHVQAGYLTPQFLEILLHFFGENKYQSVPWETYQQTFQGEIK